MKKRLYNLLLGFSPFFLGWILGFWLLPKHPWGMGFIFELIVGFICAFVVIMLQASGKFPIKNVPRKEIRERIQGNQSNKIRYVFLLTTFIIFYIIFQMFSKSSVDILVKTSLSLGMSMMIGNSMYGAFVLKYSFLENFRKNFKFVLLSFIIAIFTGFIESVFIHS